jgi:hypothetical protein
MCVALWATSVANVGAALAFSPPLGAARGLLGFPADPHPLYLWTIAELVLVLGLAYGCCAFRRQAPRWFIALAAAGKLSFFATIVAFWLAGGIPFRAVFVASADLLFAVLFLLWLVGRAPGVRAAPTSGTIVKTAT